MLLLIFVFALVAGGIGYLTRNRTAQPAGVHRPVSAPGRVPSAPSYYRSPSASYGSPSASYGSPSSSSGSPSYGSPSSYGTSDYRSGYPAPSWGTPVGRTDLADGEAETAYWVDRLGAGITALDGVGEPAGTAVTQSLSEASERHASARRQMLQAATPKQFELATRTAVEGHYYVRAARTARGLDPGPELGSNDVPALTRTRRVTVDDQEYEASGQPGERTPYYYPGGQVGNRMVPSGWYSTPWWKTALIVGGAGIGSMLLLDALFGGHHGGGGFGGFGGDHGGGFGGDHFGGGPGGFLDGNVFGGDMDGFGF